MVGCEEWALIDWIDAAFKVVVIGLMYVGVLAGVKARFRKNRKEGKMKAIALMLCAGLMCPGLALADDRPFSEQVTEDLTLGEVISTVAVSGVVFAGIVASEGMAAIPLAMATGIYLEWKTDPALRGLYRYNGQASAVSENRKWEKHPRSPWMRLKGYKTSD